MDPFSSAAATQTTGGKTTHRFEFTGSGGEYFRIWIVNLLLSIVTFGIYSAWAKVRRLRYFYGSTLLAGSSFEYHGEPLKILKGRLLAALIIVPYYITVQFAPLLSAIFLIVFLIALPFIVVKSRLFQTRMSSWRNIRFDFDGTYKRAAVVYLGLPLLTPFTLGLITPYIMYARQKFLMGEARYGSAETTFNATPGAYYIAYLIGIAIGIGGFIVIFLLAGALMEVSLVDFAEENPLSPNFALHFAFIGLLGGAIYLFAFAVIQARITNAAYGELRIGQHDLRCEIGPGKLAMLYLTNGVLTILTLGLYTPWAKVRLVKYQLECMHLDAFGDLDAFVANESKQVTATGSEVGDLLDLDFGL